MAGLDDHVPLRLRHLRRPVPRRRTRRPPHCPICEDERQYVPEDGQRWTTLDELAQTHRNELREDSELTGVGTEPWLAIGQRALLVPAGGAS